MITKVRLKNWRSHLSSELIFNKGTNALLGAIGSGKTTVLDGICFAFFGTFPTLQAKKIKLDDILMNKPIPKDRSEVELWFEFNGKIYQVKRVVERGRGTTYCEIRENGKLLEAPNSFRVTEVVKKILRANYDLFTKAVYSEQNELDYFLTLPRGQRKKKFDELLMLDRFENARASTVTLINRITDRKIGIQTAIEKIDIEGLEKSLIELKASLEKIIGEKGQFEKILVDTVGRKTSLEKEVTEFRKIKENLEKLRQRESGIKSVIEEILGSIKVLEEELKGREMERVEKELKETKERLGELEIALKDKNIRYKKFSTLQAEGKAKLESLNRDIEKLEREVEEKLRVKKDFEEYKTLIKTDIEKELEEKRKIYEKLIGELESIKFRISETQAMLQQLTLVKGRCPLCQSELTPKTQKMLIKHREQHLKALSEEMKNVLEAKEKAESEIGQVEALKRKWDEMRLELRDLEQMQGELQKLKEVALETDKSLVETRAVVEALEKEINETDAELREKNKLREELEVFLIKFRDYEGKKSRLQLLKRDEEIVKKEINETEALLAGRDLEEMENTLRGLIARAKECEVNILRCKQLAEEKSQRISECEKKLEEVKEQKEEIKKLERILRELRIFERALVATQVELREEVIGAINYFMNKIWSTLYPYPDFTGIKLSVEEDDYVLQLQERSGRFIAADGVASGGERSIACLALRIAFSTVLAPQLRLLVLDEPTANLDTLAIKTLVEILKGRINELVDQTFIITHQPELEEAVTGNAYRFERDKTMDEPTKIVPLL
ncbi:MAG: SMC family ATPase [Candidatus Aenigmarchaeota archaeon]|nr:SMC family ATPase [Candidatus Aenigmarchaeota archaeon]